MWVVTTDEFDPISQEFDTEEEARAGYKEFIQERDIAGKNYRVYLAKVIEFDGGPDEWKKRE